MPKKEAYSDEILRMAATLYYVDRLSQAEVAAAICICGEISIIGAIAAGHFTRAHHRLARQR